MPVGEEPAERQPVTEPDGHARSHDRVLGAAREVVDDVIGAGDFDTWYEYYMYFEAVDSGTLKWFEAMDDCAAELDRHVFLTDDANGAWLQHHDVGEDLEVREVAEHEVAVKRHWWWPF